MIITVGSIVGLVIIGSLAAYVIARSTRRWANIAFYLFLIAIILPTQLGLIPLYIGARQLGLVGSLWGMIILYTGMLMPLSVFLYAGFFRACRGTTRRRPRSTAPPRRGSSSASCCR